MIWTNRFDEISGLPMSSPLVPRLRGELAFDNHASRALKMDFLTYRSKTDQFFLLESFQDAYIGEFIFINQTVPIGIHLFESPRYFIMRYIPSSQLFHNLTS